MNWKRSDAARTARSTAHRRARTIDLAIVETGAGEKSQHLAFNNLRTFGRTDIADIAEDLLAARGVLPRLSARFAEIAVEDEADMARRRLHDVAEEWRRLDFALVEDDALFLV